MPGASHSTIPAKPGGLGFLAEMPVSYFDNTNGYVAGGGGGGGGSGEVGGSNSNQLQGSGGAGISPGAIGPRLWTANYQYTAQPGTETTGGKNNFGAIGYGGDRGAPGWNGGNTGSSYNAWEYGAAAGDAIKGNGYILSSTGLVAGKLFGAVS